MRRTWLALAPLFVCAAFVCAALGACSASSDDVERSAQPGHDGADSDGAHAAALVAKPSAPLSAEEAAALEAGGGVAYFAGGCFWGVEHFLEQIDGVRSVESGYMGGDVDDPSYEQVSSHDSGHLETVRVYFDPAKVSYEEVAKRFFEIHDPTQANGQGPDIGPQYLSAVFVASPEQREVTEDLIRRLKDRGYDVATQVRDAESFWLAEDYHQDYYVRHDKTPYCHTPVNRFGD